MHNLLQHMVGGGPLQPRFAHEGMPQQLARAVTVSRLALEAARHEILERVTEGLSAVGRVRERGGLAPEEAFQDLEGLHAGEGRLAVRELHCRDSKRPYVCLGVIPALLLCHLGRHPAGGAHEGHPRLPPRTVGGCLKLAQSDIVAPVDQQVVGLDVPMDQALPSL
eukprot:CAMPEP_0114149330 /NCGR_PEP_ID=MMETSP0043_2-20121206/22100_1 /TAXON_ID=464988 /ORGANISM="Hemiselmis andersenii, Strain CCMP644" /LENGTH=165 /DNA_ID=CAMNT_0001243963 /DNA_START=124 /DNA_END=621 /DNA_ORIENTATION=-